MLEGIEEFKQMVLLVLLEEAVQEEQLIFAQILLVGRVLVSLVEMVRYYIFWRRRRRRKNCSSCIDK